MSIDSEAADATARALLDIVPLVMRAIRAEMRSNRKAELSVPQFRVLSYVHRRGSTSLSDIAEHMGLTLPSMSSMVDALVGRRFLDRRPDSQDRRRVAIALTDGGQEAWAAAHNATRDSLIRRLRGLGPEKRAELEAALATLRRLFSEEGDGSSAEGGTHVNP